jgi:hypothetical protein
MKCPECGASCSREDYGSFATEWYCSECGWDESFSFPMQAQDWQNYLNEGWAEGLSSHAEECNAVGSP